MSSVHDELKKKVEELYHFRDHYFENHDISEAADKPERIQEKLREVLTVFDDLESEAVLADRAVFLYLKGRALNVTGEFSSGAEACLTKSVKLNPDLVEAHNELGESYMRKHEWTQARICFEVRYDKFTHYLLFIILVLMIVCINIILIETSTNLIRTVSLT